MVLWIKFGSAVLFGFGGFLFGFLLGDRDSKRVSRLTRAVMHLSVYVLVLAVLLLVVGFLFWLLGSPVPEVSFLTIPAAAYLVCAVIGTAASEDK